MRQVFVSQINNLQNFNQMQKEAAVDLLLLIMYADGALDPNETEYIDRLLLDSTWAGDEALEDYLHEQSKTVIETLRDKDQVIRFVEHAKLRIGNTETIQSIYTLCATMANSDHNVDPKEMDILKLLMDSLS